jgi:hypothetical protein
MSQTSSRFQGLRAQLSNQRASNRLPRYRTVYAKWRLTRGFQPERTADNFAPGEEVNSAAQNENAWSEVVCSQRLECRSALVAKPTVRSDIMCNWRFALSSGCRTEWLGGRSSVSCEGKVSARCRRQIPHCPVRP